MYNNNPLALVVKAIFGLAVIFGLTDLILNVKQQIHVDPKALKDLQYQQDIAFQSYLSLYGKSYKDSDIFELHRYEFLKTWQQIVNQPLTQTYQLDFNHMSDWTEYEYSKVMGVYSEGDQFGPVSFTEKTKEAEPKVKLDVNLNFNTTVDWRTITNAPLPKNGRKNRNKQGVSVITPVKDQTLRKTCSSSYAFATVSALETLYLLENEGHIQVELSEQQLIDCTNIKKPQNSNMFQNRGCSGGYLKDSLTYAVKNPIFKQKSYPFKGTENKCKNLKAYDGRSGEREYMKITNFTRIMADPQEVKKALNYGPVIATIEASSDSFKNYKSGIIDFCTPVSQQSHAVKHAVLLIGYNSEMINGVAVEYFIFKNSFGKQWGDQGFGKISADKKNVCGILSDVYMPIYKLPLQSRNIVTMKDQIVQK